jgi:aminoglycoside 6'-N-acetyltransferase I
VQPQTPDIRITDLSPDDAGTVEQVADLLWQAFAHIPQWLPTRAAATEEVGYSFGPNRLSRVARDAGGRAVGWAGGIPEYNGHAYELHPLAVKPSHQGRGIGTALVRDMEAQVRQRGAITLYLGTDDEFGGTNLYGVDVYPNVVDHIAAIRNANRHPFEFYQKLGFTIVGIMPDANGFGKPDIWMAKRIT